MSAGDYRRFRSRSPQFRNPETDSQFAKARHWQAFEGTKGKVSRCRTGWLGREGSNPAIILCHTRIFPFRTAHLIPSLIRKAKSPCRNDRRRGGLHRGQGLESERRSRAEHHPPRRELLWIKRRSFEFLLARRRLLRIPQGMICGCVLWTERSAVLVTRLECFALVASGPTAVGGRRQFSPF